MAESYHGNCYVVMATKKCTLAGQSVRKIVRRCHYDIIGDLGDVSRHCDVTLALNDRIVPEFGTRVPGDITHVTNGTIVTIRVCMKC